MSSNIVLVTGFGPFGSHKINASWEAVKLLKNHPIDNTMIVTEEIPVTYQYIDENVPLLWKKHSPKLVVHVGVMSDPKLNYIRIETQANRCEYVKVDCEGCCHSTSEACKADEGDDCVSTKLDVQNICTYVYDNCQTDVKISEDAGRYLCEYIYYKSLNIDASRCLFIHVPMLENPYTKEEVANVISFIIKGALQQVQE